MALNKEKYLMRRDVHTAHAPAQAFATPPLGLAHLSLGSSIGISRFVSLCEMRMSSSKFYDGRRQA